MDYRFIIDVLTDEPLTDEQLLRLNQLFADRLQGRPNSGRLVGVPIRSRITFDAAGSGGYQAGGHPPENNTPTGDATPV